MFTVKENCPVWKKCGGCQLQNLSYPEQLRHKQAQAISILGKFGHIEEIIGMQDAQTIQAAQNTQTMQAAQNTQSSQSPLHYRNKVCSVFAYDRHTHRIISGNYQEHSHAVVPVEHCLIEDKICSDIINDIRNMLPSFKIQAYDEQTGSGFLRHVLVRRGFATGEVMVVLVAASPIFKLQKPFLAKLLGLHPEITTVILNINDRFGPVVLGSREKILYGPGYIEDILCGKRFTISSGSFYQINPVQTEKLYGKAIEFAGLTGKETVLDAYCGVGTIGICASDRAKQVIGVEINRDAVKNAIANAKRNGITNCWFTAGDAGQYMEKMASDGHRADVVFMDPPRAGSDERFLSSLIRTRPERVVYVSCCLETLARDLDYLTDGGYAVKKIQPVDMFPFTNHVETVVCLSNKNSK